MRTSGVQVTFSHLALSVADVDVSARFYQDAFGFVGATPYRAGGRRAAALMEGTPEGFTGMFLRLGDLLLELLHHADGGPQPDVPRRAGEYGYAHMGFVVQDLEQTLQRVAAAGGQVRTRLQQRFGHGRETTIVFCTDPDGNRIELIRHPDADEAAAHAKFLGLTGIGWPATT